MIFLVSLNQVDSVILVYLGCHELGILAFFWISRKFSACYLDIHWLLGQCPHHSSWYGACLEVDAKTNLSQARRCGYHTAWLAGASKSKTNAAGSSISPWGARFAISFLLYSSSFVKESFVVTFKGVSSGSNHTLSAFTAHQLVFCAASPPFLWVSHTRARLTWFLGPYLGWVLHLPMLRYVEGWPMEFRPDFQVFRENARLSHFIWQSKSPGPATHLTLGVHAPFESLFADF